MQNELLGKLFQENKNVIVEGGVNSGKTMNVLFPIVDSIIERKESLVVLDSKEEYLNKYYEKFYENDYNTVVINLRDPSLSERWNPLQYPYELFKSGNSDNAQAEIDRIGKTIFYDKKVLDPFWTDSAKDLFTGMCLGLFEDANEEEINLNSINNMLNSVGKKYNDTTVDKAYFTLKGENSAPYVFASSTILAPTETKGGILATAKQKLRLYVSRENLSKVLSNTTFNLKDIVNKPTAIIIIGKDEEKSFVNDIVSMFISQVYSILVQLKSNNKVNIILDNIDSLNNFDSLEVRCKHAKRKKCNFESLVDILSSSISRNVKTYVATRSLNDLAFKYGNSINYLCDLIKLNNNEVTLNGNVVDKIDNKSKGIVSSKKVIINSPKHDKDEIKLFDLENYVTNKKQ